MSGFQNIESLALKFGSSLSPSEREKGGIKIEKKAVEEALLGFHYSIVVEVFSLKPVNENGFIDQFTSLWRGREGISIRALGGALFIARFVGRHDMCLVLEVKKAWLFQDDLVWVVHNVPPLNMTEAVAMAIGGLLGSVVEVDKNDGRDCIGAGSIELVSHLEEIEGNGESNEVVQPSRDIDLNMPFVGNTKKVLDSLRGRDSIDRDVDHGVLSQDSDPFNLIPIIEAEDDVMAVIEDGLNRVHKNQWSIMDQAEATYEGLGMSCIHIIEPRGITGGYTELCLLMGDFNDLLLESEKEGGILIRGGIGDEGFIQERLDRVLATHNWMQEYHQAIVKHVVLEGSDHAMLVLSTVVDQPRKTKRFMYDPRWNLDPSCEKVLNEQRGICWLKDMIRDAYQQPVFDVLFCRAMESEAQNVLYLLQRIWHYTRNGIYSVKTGYLVTQEMNRNRELGRKGVGQASMANSMDMVPFARVFWFGSPLQLDVALVVGEDFLAYWKWLCAKYEGEGETNDLIRWVVCGLWRIWKCRNSLVFEKTAVEPIVALQLLRQHLAEMALCDGEPLQQLSHRQQMRRTKMHGWLWPPFGTIKINCDGAWCNSTEAKTVGLALMWCMEGGLESVQLETDSQVLVDMIRGSLQP
ncbi:hypothetical protein D8674_033635 [Pyrus ussuriensis x Pyrus communis]|uniref:RNase H type-1 domain-containing protein n=1 Tax=Pyrus ussuriensis x Pyrus communis TaxID=2448454 RepID=A0A5N5HTH6_9ROSA|nr:hypothetical protein D8674_033635 [Pyrus ussuriensis x Pyrus communis]